MKKRKVALKEQYSGKNSRDFWDRVNELSRNEGWETAYCLGCALQNLEEQVLNFINNREKKLRT